MKWGLRPQPPRAGTAHGTRAARLLSNASAMFLPFHFFYLGELCKLHLFISTK
uniref:Uncharacterized protein n=1 Tax=viral metagenome TaxID=1070528 RepID=A0A6C0JWV0_9ZZZZ